MFIRVHCGTLVVAVSSAVQSVPAELVGVPTSSKLGFCRRFVAFVAQVGTGVGTGVGLALGLALAVGEGDGGRVLLAVGVRLGSELGFGVIFGDKEGVGAVVGLRQGGDVGVPQAGDGDGVGSAARLGTDHTSWAAKRLNVMSATDSRGTRDLRSYGPIA